MLQFMKIGTEDCVDASAYEESCALAALSIAACESSSTTSKPAPAAQSSAGDHYLLVGIAKHSSSLSSSGSSASSSARAGSVHVDSVPQMTALAERLAPPVDRALQRLLAALDPPCR